jgi:hypothetical protein
MFNNAHVVTQQGCYTRSRFDCTSDERDLLSVVMNRDISYQVTGHSESGRHKHVKLCITLSTTSTALFSASQDRACDGVQIDSRMQCNWSDSHPEAWWQRLSGEQQALSVRVTMKSRPTRAMILGNRGRCGQPFCFTCKVVLDGAQPSPRSTNSVIMVFVGIVDVQEREKQNSMPEDRRREEKTRSTQEGKRS